MARLRRAGREAAGLEGVSPALRAGASNFSLRGQRKVTKRKATPRLFARLCRVPSAHPLVRRRSLDILSRGLDKRARLSE